MLRKSEITSIKLCYPIEYKFKSIVKDLIVRKNDNIIECYRQIGDIYLTYVENSDILYITSGYFYRILPKHINIFGRIRAINKILFKEYFNIP